MKLGKKEVSNFNEPYIIAEIGANHNGDMDLAKKMIDSAKACGADAVKFQSWTKTSIVSEFEYQNNQKYEDSPKKHFGSLEEMIEKYYLRKEQHVELRDYCKSVGIDFASTPFSEEEVDLLVALDVPFIKVASMDINNHRLLKYMAKQGKPMIVSTGMSSLQEVLDAVEVIEKAGNDKIILLHCISIYPPKAEDINLNNIKMLQDYFPKCPIGFSDHTIGISVPLASVALGASVIEKHFTLDKNLPGWDHEISASPDELIEIAEQSKIIAKALGSYQRIVSQDELQKRSKFRRSIVLARAMKKGEVITESDLDFKRPGTFISPIDEKYVVGRKLNCDKKLDDLLKWSDLM